ncbi:hypothetical protein GobsT_65670 [Gemmata obscuriglobus]|uniref:hypothetical protein n=1 Tax=Gemmata obscuriglobus TaxID=114 RepID=UPI0011CD308C|nr:hypothetical protein [Gemmata obscuriglobus]QEG31723.1 hypothetical protein GobsT_65670 [Gemmata obscuriglobus]VTS11069.1 unnamed protein product [Gemmata obscuriglobus UQM 2246]
MLDRASLARLLVFTLGLVGVLSLVIVAEPADVAAAAAAPGPKIDFNKNPAGVGNPAAKGILEYKVTWTNCTNAQKLEVTIYKVNALGVPPTVIGGTAIDPIPGGANGNLTITSGGLTTGDTVLFKVKVVDNGTPPLVIAEATSATAVVP